MCAWKYPQEWFEDGDIIEPSDFRLNQQEYLGEINGSLDNDNLYKKMFDQDNFTQHSFNKVYHSNGVSNELPEGYNDPDSSSYVGGETPGELKSTLGGGVHFVMSNGGWMSQAGDEYNISPTSTPGTKFTYPEYRPTILPRVKFTAEEDGMILVDMTCHHSWEDEIEAFIEGANQFTNQVDYGFYRPKGARFKFLNAYVQCIMYRVVCNGFTVCQTGPIGCEYISQPVYLCGALPISSGENVVQVEVRFVWYSPGTDKMLDASSRNPKVTIIEGGDQAITTRTCSVNGVLIVNHRKR